MAGPDNCASEQVWTTEGMVSSADFKPPAFTGMVYEVIRLIGGTPIFLADHIKRLLESVKLMGADPLLGTSFWMQAAADFIGHTATENCNIKLVYSWKGKAENAYCYAINTDYPTKQIYENGVAAGLFAAVRSNPNAKTEQETRKAAVSFIRESGVYEAILVTPQDCVTEGSRSNIFFIKNRKILTAPEYQILVGITRQYAIQAAANAGIEVEVREIRAAELASFDAAFITGTSPKILPINKIGDIHFHAQNEVTLEIMKGYQAILDNYIAQYNYGEQ
jgi:branched-chain amino acid aminotransferase